MIIGVVNGKQMTYTDSTGKQVTELVKVEPKKFKKAGEMVAKAFKDFIDSMWKAFKDGNYEEVSVEKHWFKADKKTVKKGNHIVDIINSLNNIGTVVDAVEHFIDVIVKTHEIRTKKGINLGAYGHNMAAMLINFVAQFQKSFGRKG